MQRYVIAGADICEEHPDGKWVLYSDAQAIIARLTAELEAEKAKRGAQLEAVDAETRACITELHALRLLLNGQMEAVDISREDAVYGICIDALSARIDQRKEAGA